VIIRDQSGFRGGWTLRGARGYTCHGEDREVVDYVDGYSREVLDGMRAMGSSIAQRARCSACHRWADQYSYAPRYGLATPHAATWGDPPRVLARGHCAQGDAGRAGGGDEVLVVLADGEECWIARSGRVYGRPATIRLGNEGGTLSARTLAQVEEETADRRPVEEVLE
jgi:hypothetical protein